MVSRLFGGSPFEDSVEKATSELVPKGEDDLALNLEISDQIRSKSVLAKDAMRILKKRITNNNPNVQLLALNLTDTCVKNGGNHFLIEIASQEFVDTLVSIIKSPPSACNPEVMQKLLGLIQTWGMAFEGKPELLYVTNTYRLLKQEGYPFPKIDKSTSVMIDTATPPEWSDSDVCVRCRTSFTMMNRKHHCRNCGQTFCGECSSKTTALPHIGINDPVRVCDVCFIKKQLKTRGSVDSKPLLNSVPSTLYSNSILSTANENNNTSNYQNATQEEVDEDLKKAIELSLKEAEYNRNYVQPALQKAFKKEEVHKKQEDEGLDEDIAAAIAASLRDIQKKTSYTTQYPQAAQNNTSGHSSYFQTFNQTASTQYELSTTEAENIHHFSEALERIQQNGGDLMRDRQVQELHERVGELKSKVTKNLTETIQKHQDLVDMHEKLSQVVKLYDRLLDERLSNAYNRRSISSYTIPQRVTSPGVSGVGNTYPILASSTNTSNIYPHAPSYPVASAPVPSPTYFAAQTALPTQYVQSQSKTIESTPIGTLQTLPQQPQLTQSTSSALPQMFVPAHALPTPPNDTARNNTPGEYNASTSSVHQAYTPQSNDISAHTPQPNGTSVYTPQSNNTSVYTPQLNYGVDNGYQYQQVPPQSHQPNYYQYQPPESSSQIPTTQSQEGPPLIEL